MICLILKLFQAFEDMKENTRIMTWYGAMKSAVENHEGQTLTNQFHAFYRRTAYLVSFHSPYLGFQYLL